MRLLYLIAGTIPLAPPCYRDYLILAEDENIENSILKIEKAQAIVLVKRSFVKKIKMHIVVFSRDHNPKNRVSR